MTYSMLDAPQELEVLPKYYRQLGRHHASRGDADAAKLCAHVADTLERALDRPDPGGYLTASQVARRYGLSEYTVREYAKAKRFTGAEKLGRIWRFKASALRYLGVGAPGERPRVVQRRTFRELLAELEGR